MAKSDRKTVDKIFVLLGLVMVVVLVVVGGLAWKASSFAKSSVETQLEAQQIFFPPKGSVAISELPASDQVQMNKYAGQQLVNGAQAKVYADNFIAYHLTKVADGQTYAQVSTQALANPTNTKLKSEEQALFQGETLRGLLLGDGYSYWTFGQIAGYVAVSTFVGATVMAILVLLGLRHLSKAR
jgi:hypothetical protein